MQDLLQPLLSGAELLQLPEQLWRLHKSSPHLKDGLSVIDFCGQLCRYSAKCHLKCVAPAHRVLPTNLAKIHAKTLGVSTHQEAQATAAAGLIQ